MTSFGYVVLELLHVLAAVIGFGALGATGTFARLLSRCADPVHDDALRRFFRPGHNLASAAIGLVPLLGGALLIAGHGKDVHLLFPWIGLSCWVVAFVVASVVIWPAERRIQRSLADEEGDRELLVRLARRCSTGAVVTTALFLCAFVVMIGQP